VRCEAVAMVASYGDKTVAAPLLPLLGDPKLSVRQQATQVLGAWREQGAVTPMLALLARSQQDEVAAGALLKALGQIASPEALEAVCQLLRDAQTSSTLRLQAALTLAALIPEVQAQRQCDDAPKPTSAEPDLIAFLTTLTQDADPHVCRVALLSLGTFGKDNASAVLLKALRGELLESPQAVSTTSPEPDELGIADFPTSTLAALQAAQTAHAAPAFGERQRVMQRHAASVLRDIDIAGAQEALLSAAESDDVVLRAEALVSLGHRGDPESLAVVRQGCMASNRDVRLAAIEALRRFATADICDVLVDLLRVERDPLVTVAILAVLSSHGDSRAV
jgi:HEAT repeat protein